MYFLDVHLRRAMTTLVVAAVVAVGALMGPSMAGRLEHRRDVDAYQDYVVTYISNGTQDDKDWAIEHPDDVLSEGNRACEWLANRPSAPDVDPTGAFYGYNLGTAYLKEASVKAPLPLTKAGRSTLVAGAWGYLCWSERREKTAPMSNHED